jgi:nitrite transporter NirC
MPIPIPEAVDENAALARSKADQLRTRPIAYLLSAVLAGAFIGVGVVLLAAAVGPLLVGGSVATKLTSGAIFGVALTLVVFAGTSLFTGEVMFMLQGLVHRSVKVYELVAIWIAALVGNFIGSFVFAWMVYQSGVLSLKPKPGAAAPGLTFITSAVTGKIHATDGQLFWRAVLCNMLVCLALWMGSRTKSDPAKLVLIWWCLFAFIAAGFEHSIVNMTVFSLAILSNVAGWSDLWHNLLLTVPGNIVGGGVIVGLAYGYLGRTKTSATMSLAGSPTPTPPTPEPAYAGSSWSGAR